MLNILRNTTRVLKGPCGSRKLSVKCIADFKLSQEKSRRVIDALNNSTATQLMQLPMVTQDLAYTLEKHKEKFGRITLHTTWSKIGNLDLELMKDLCIVLSEYEDAINLSINTEFEEEDIEEEEEGMVGLNHEAREKKVLRKAPEFITKLDDEYLNDETATSAKVAEKPTPEIKAVQENKILNFSLGLNAIVPGISTKSLPSSVVAVSVETSSIAWCSMTSDLRVHNWELRPILSTQGGKNTFPQIYEEFSSLYSAMSLPTEDGLYITEESSAQVPVFKARHEALFSTLVAERQAQENKQARGFSNHIYRLKPSVVVNMFKLDVGGQRVSSNNTILDIKKKKCREAEGIHIPEFLYSQWYRMRRYDQHIAGNCLLTALAFYKKLEFSASTQKTSPNKERKMQL